jgi:hypothetical protein
VKAIAVKTEIQLRSILNKKDGALLNKYCRFYDKRIGQSVTLSGRQIVRHMMSHINQQITDEYKHDGDGIVYGDSVTGDTIIRTDKGNITIAELFDLSLEKCISNGKEYALWNDTKVIGFNAESMESVPSNISHVMRHKTKKKLYRITTENGKQVVVTEDHSVIVDRDGFLVECKPTDIQQNDLIITLCD